MCCGAIVAIVAWLWNGVELVTLSILVAISAAMLASTLIGILLPLSLRRFCRALRLASGLIALVIADLFTLACCVGISSGPLS